MVKVVFDTVIFVRGLINPYSWWGKTLFTSSSSYQLYLSPPVITEILDVLERPELTDKFKSLKDMKKSVVLDLLAQAAIVEIPVKIPQVSRDPKDNKFLATARRAQADYLVTEDQDLLVLIKYEGTKIITAKEFLELLHQTHAA